MNDLSNKLLLIALASIPAIVVTLGFAAMDDWEVTILNLSIGVPVWFFLSALFLYKWRKEDNQNIQTEQPKEYVPDSPVKELFDLLVLKGDILENYQFKYNGNIYSINSNVSGWWCNDSDKHELTWITNRESNWLFHQIIQHTKQRGRQAKAKQREQVGRDIQEQYKHEKLNISVDIASDQKLQFYKGLEQLKCMLELGEISKAQYNATYTKLLLAYWKA